MSDDEHPIGRAGASVAQLRQLVMVVAASMAALLGVLWFALDGELGSDLTDPLPWVLLGVGTAVCLVGVRMTRALPLTATDLDGFLARYRTATIVGMACAEVPALLGFVSAFLVEAVWPLLVGLVPTLLGLWAVAPTAERLRAYDRMLCSRGHDVQPSALLEPPPGAH